MNFANPHTKVEWDVRGQGSKDQRIKGSKEEIA